MLIVIENALEVVLDAASIALNTKLNVVCADTVLGVPEITAVPPSLPSLDNVIPGGITPDCFSKVTLPADSGSTATTVNLPAVLSNSVPNEPAAVTKVGCAFIFT